MIKVLIRTTFKYSYISVINEAKPRCQINNEFARALRESACRWQLQMRRGDWSDYSKISNRSPVHLTFKLLARSRSFIRSSVR